MARHIPSILQLPEREIPRLQIINNGNDLTAAKLTDGGSGLSLSEPILVKDSPDSIGMSVLSFPGRNVSVRDVANIIGHKFPVRVIDVEHQEELEGWTLGDLVDYFEDDDRVTRYEHEQEQEQEKSSEPSGSTNKRQRRKAAEKCRQLSAARQSKVLNQISLEFSKTALGNHIASPQFVRDIDWIDIAWPRRSKGADFDYPNVQKYCLTSAAGCYTDFHVDFGGTSVWYHILSGKKTFCLVPPSDKNLNAYEEWLCQKNQADIFFPDMIDDRADVIKLSLEQGQTLVIPTGWIHAVFTPQDSVVVGGNFLHGLDIPLQLQIHCIEARTKVQASYRFPNFVEMNFYAGGYYLKRMRQGNVCRRELDGMGQLMFTLKEWWKVYSKQISNGPGPSVSKAAQHAAITNGCSTVDEFLTQFENEINRIEADGIVPNPKFPKTKLRLKIPATDASAQTKAPTPTQRSPRSVDEKFRINLSSTATHANTANQKRSFLKGREDRAWIDDQHSKDDEWIPPEAKKAKRAHNEKLGKKEVSRSSNGKQIKAPKSRPVAAAKKTTTRERLLKRLR